MTKKEKYDALVAEIERQYEETSIGLNEHENGIERGRMEVINALQQKIDSMQEEPVSVWHDASKIPDNPEDMVVEYSEYGITIIPACKMSRVKGAKWARLDDILKL